MKNTIKLLLAYHKQFELFSDDVLTPIHVGRALSSQNEQNQWLYDNMIGDNTGDNISHKNRNYNELTALYWAWKNYDKLGDPDYIGLMHYRRYFFFNGEKKLRDTCAGVDENFLEKIGYNAKNIHDTIHNFDIVCPKPFKRSSVYEHYNENHRALSLDIAIDIIHEMYPDYIEACDEYMQSSDVYLYNMFIMKKELFFQYANWIFSVLSEYEKRVDIGENRLFISERLTGIFINYMSKMGKKINHVATMFIESEHTIPILMATDDLYVFPTIVAMISILKNAKKMTRYEFHLMIPSVLRQENIEKFLHIKDYYHNCSIHFIDMKDSFNNAYLVGSRITKPTYYRLLAAELLPNYDKCLYLDSDIIALEDLTELFELSVEDYYVAGVKAPSYHFPEDGNQRYLARSGLPSIDNYINAGVLLLNLKKIREHNLTEKFLEMITRELPSQDQDIINYVCYGNIHHIHFKYNNMISKHPHEFDKLKRVFSSEEVEVAHKRPTIIHYCDKVKPWDDLTCLYSDIWWQYGRLYSLYDYEMLECYMQKAKAKSAQNMDKLQKDFEQLDRKCRNLQTKKANVCAERDAIKRSISYKIGRLFRRRK